MKKRHLLFPAWKTHVQLSIYTKNRASLSITFVQYELKKEPPVSKNRRLANTIKVGKGFVTLKTFIPRPLCVC